MKALTLAGVLAVVAIVGTTTTRSAETKEKKAMELGNFSVSLNVKDIKASKAFYEKLDFKEVAGKLEQNWIVLQNGNARIGLFQGMFDKNIMTFNPGWDRNAKPLSAFDDVREIQRVLESGGIVLTTKADLATTGPANLTLMDPDGNMILLDQFVPKPGKH